MSLSGRTARTPTPRRFLVPAALAAAIVLPFATLELLLAQPTPDGFPAPLFLALWVLALAALLVAQPVARQLRAGVHGVPQAFRVAALAIVLVALAGSWLTLVLDQLPCFLGVPNCD